MIYTQIHAAKQGEINKKNNFTCAYFGSMYGGASR
ncbi:hypothetical protein SAMN04488122_5456 [Chitinophaga arvensicola]|uniref:Uncharacterized protein n=1 Tax=Chitinophaga arvensicola TaxID=29529 RepID=A0A1I0SAN9_9BACT|nr:hypothetical protein SAMN04488122_5456 [Chitinophaga arvensicola]